MLTEHHKQHYLAGTCPSCPKKLGVHHAYPLDAHECISLLVTTAPMCLRCAQQAAEQRQIDKGLHQFVRIVAIVKAANNSPSSKLFRTIPSDPATTCLRLFWPERVEIHHVTINDGAEIVRPASHDEVFGWMAQSIQDASTAANGDQDEIRSITIALAKFLRLNKPE